jgi:uncharacterized protein with FMN-binding domain
MKPTGGGGRAERRTDDEMGGFTMKNSTRTRVAAAALASAIGIGTLAYALRALPSAQRALALLRGGQGGGTQGGSSTGASAIAQNAFLLTSSATPAAGATLASLKTGTFTGKREYAYYGYVKVQAVIQNGSLADIKVVEYPSDNGRSRYINSIALPYLIQESVSANSWRVDLISGATFTSVAFQRSLQEALKAAGA